VDAARSALGHEMLDVIWNLCALANTIGIDLDQATRTMMAVNVERPWSSGRCKLFVYKAFE